MNIIFEGIDAVGKSSLIKELIKKLDKVNIKNILIDEIEESPLKNVLSNMLLKDPFFNCKEAFKTSIYETFILGADFFYKQEFFRDENSINIYDRDFLTILCYQKIIIEKEYGTRADEFFNNFIKCILFDLKKVDLLIYVSVPLNLSFERIEKRDNYQLNEEEKDFLKLAKSRFEIELIPRLKAEKIEILELDGEEDFDKNLKKILKRVKIEKIKDIK